MGVATFDQLGQEGKARFDGDRTVIRQAARPVGHVHAGLRDPAGHGADTAPGAARAAVFAAGNQHPDTRRSKSMTRFKQQLFALAAAAVCATVTATPALAQSSAGDWRQTVFLYGMGAMIEGDAQVGPLQVPVDVGLSDFLRRPQVRRHGGVPGRERRLVVHRGRHLHEPRRQQGHAAGSGQRGPRRRADDRHGDRRSPHPAASRGPALARLF